MNKREARQIALHMIFEMEFKSQDEWGQIMDIRMGPDVFFTLSDEMDFYAKKIPDVYSKYIKDCVDGVFAHVNELDAHISELSKEWDIKRISKVSLAILRLSIFEMKYTDVPVGASINEAVDLAKDYDSEEAGSFVNGILGSFDRQRNG
ncbi:MAG: transcription antitermination factor NusB [Clostridia bacterium]